MPPTVRKVALTSHVVCSVGWLGGVASFLVLALLGLTVEAGIKVRAFYIAAEAITTFIIVPLAVASLVSGVVQSLGTPWGVFRHYWVLIKLILTVASTFLLIVHLAPIRQASGAASDRVLAPDDLRAIRVQLVVDSAGALLVLIVTTALSVVKPAGKTPYGWTKEK